MNEVGQKEDFSDYLNGKYKPIRCYDWDCRYLRPELKAVLFRRYLELMVDLTRNDDEEDRENDS